MNNKSIKNIKNAQLWIENNYPYGIQKKLIKLDLSGQNLEGYLNLTSFVNLEELKCSGNLLTTLILSNCPNLRKIEADSNVRIVASEHLTQQWETEKKRKKRKARFLPQNVLVWTNLHPDFTLELTKIWQDLGFSREQAQAWIEVGFKPTDYEICLWLRDIAKKEAEWILNNATCQEAKRRFENWQEKQKQIELEAQIEQLLQIPSKY